MGDHIVLDRDVRDWVLVPLTMSIVLMMLIRQYATQVRIFMSARTITQCFLSRLLRYRCATMQWLMGGSKSQQKVDLKEVKEKQVLARSQLLRGACVFLTEGAFRQRKAYFTAKVRLGTMEAVSRGNDNACSVHVCVIKNCRLHAGDWCAASEVGAEVCARTDADQP